LRHGTPVVIVGDSGQWANILSTLCYEKFSNVSEDVVLDLIKGKIWLDKSFGKIF